MLEHQHRFRLQRMAAVFGVSRSGYYQWRRTGEEPGEKALRRAALDEKINKAFTQGKQRDGARRIQVALAENGDHADLKTILNSMKRQGLKAKAARKFKVTTDSNHQLPVAPNLLEQNFSADAPNQKWVGDITYLLTNEGWLYLAVIIDLYSRAVIGWSMNSRMTAELTCKALQMALLRRGRPKNVIVHSDRGSQYCSTAYRNLIAKHQLIQSMSRKGNCWDNAVAESFFHTLKVELLKDEPLTDRVTLQQQVFEYIEVDYNKTRRHSAIGYLSPENYELKKVA
jgi:putative transposase